MITSPSRSWALKKSTLTDPTKFFLQVLAPAMEEPKTIKAVLRMAAKEGVDPKALYATAVSTRPPNLSPAPEDAEIFPL